MSQWLKEGRIFVDGQVMTRREHLLKAGDVILVGPKKQRELSYRGIKILYEDRSMLIISKPAFLLSVPKDENEAFEESALHLMREYLGINALYAVHRIDRETSGVLLFAKGRVAEERFSALFEAHDITREYLAIVEGHLSSRTGTWKSYLLETPSYDVIETDETQGRLAITHYEVLRYSPCFTYLRLNLETGRKHQIRVHCRQAGHCVVGDRRYGSLANPVRRLALHAATLAFIHPFTGKTITISSHPPPSLLSLGLTKN